MDKKQIKINILIVLVVAFLIISALMMRFEFNPFSYFIESDDEENVVLSDDNSNGIYRYRENLAETLNLFYGCSVSYFDNYILVINDNYYTYRHSCVGTFLTGSGKTKDLKFKFTLEKTQYIIYEDNEYYKTNVVGSIKTINYLKDFSNEVGPIYPENYKVLFKEAQREGEYFDFIEAVLRSSPQSYFFDLDYIEGTIFDLKLMSIQSNEPIYTYRVGSFDELPDLKIFGSNIVVIERIINGNRYSYGFKVFNELSMNYDIKSKFPIIVDGDTLTTNNSIYIAYNKTDNKYIMLVGDDLDFCVADSKSDKVVSYVFEINYNYYTKGFDNPKYIRKIYERDGCKYVNEVMRWNK